MIAIRASRVVASDGSLQLSEAIVTGFGTFIVLNFRVSRHYFRVSRLESFKVLNLDVI